MKGDLCNNLDAFPGIRLFEQTEQKFRRIRFCLEEKKRKINDRLIVGLF